jgi:uncharacterized membrane protein YvlD (DUF360 family)
VRLPSDGLAPLEARLWGSFLGRCVRRFIAMAGIDRCIVLSSQAFTALIPLLILVSTLAPVGDEDVVSRTVIRRFGLTGDSADAVTQLFDIPAGATTSGVSFFSGFLLLFSGISFTRRFQTMYRSAWKQNSTAVRNNLFAALGLVTLLAELLVLYGLQSLVRGLSLGWLVSLPLSAITGLVVWTSIPYLLLNRAVHWRRLLFTGGLAAVCMSFYGLATTIYMPRMVEKYTSEFGLFGITIAIIGWLLAVSGVLVVSAAVGAELDASQDRWVLWLKTRLRLEDPGLERPAPVAVEHPTGLTPHDLVLLVRMLENSVVISAGVWVATALVPGIEVTGKFFTYLWVSLLLGLVNAVLGPLLRVIAFPLNVMTMGSVALLVNAVLLATTAGLSVHLSIDGFSTAVLAALVISLVTTLIELAIRPIREPSDESSPVG